MTNLRVAFRNWLLKKSAAELQEDARLWREHQERTNEMLRKMEQEMKEVHS